MNRPVRTLLYSTLFPSSVRPGHGIFVETRLRELLRLGGVETRVVAPVPWFPLKGERYGEYGRMAATPQRETRNGIDVLHPRYPLIPKVGMTVAPILLAAASLGPIRKLQREGFDFDVIDAHYFYPDGVAAALLAKWLDKPLTITARGSDVNLIAEHALPRRMMRWASQAAAATVAVSEALARQLVAIGAPPERSHVLRNGVDTNSFKPEPGDAARSALALQDARPLLLSVGNLLPVKRHELVIEALEIVRRSHPQARLAIVGGGPRQAFLEERARARGLSDVVLFAGAVPQTALSRWYSAADVLVLASSREGWPNVLLEAMACGTPVVASDVGGVREIVTDRILGSVLEMQTAQDVASAIMYVIAGASDREAILRHAQTMGWASVSESQRELIRRVAGRQPILP